MLIDIVDNMSTKDLVQYVFDDMLRYIETIPEVEFLEDCQDYWEEHFDDVVKDIKEYANSEFKKPMEDRKIMSNNTPFNVTLTEIHK